MKLYVIVRSDLSKSQQAVQAGHALAMALLRHRVRAHEWNNETLVYLKVKNLESLQSLLDTLNEYQQYPMAWHEPDLSNEMTSFSVFECVEHLAAQTLLDELPLM